MTGLVLMYCIVEITRKDTIRQHSHSPEAGLDLRLALLPPRLVGLCTGLGSAGSVKGNSSHEGICDVLWAHNWSWLYPYHKDRSDKRWWVCLRTHWWSWCPYGWKQFDRLRCGQWPRRDMSENCRGCPPSAPCPTRWSSVSQHGHADASMRPQNRRGAWAPGCSSAASGY